MKLDTDIIRGELLRFQSALEVVPVLDRCSISLFKTRTEFDAVRCEDCGDIVISLFFEDLTFKISNIGRIGDLRHK